MRIWMYRKSGVWFWCLKDEMGETVEAGNQPSYKSACYAAGKAFCKVEEPKKLDQFTRTANGEKF